MPLASVFDIMCSIICLLYVFNNLWAVLNVLSILIHWVINLQLQFVDGFWRLSVLMVAEFSLNALLSHCYMSSWTVFSCERKRKMLYWKYLWLLFCSLPCPTVVLCSVAGKDWVWWWDYWPGTHRTNPAMHQIRFVVMGKLLLWAPFSVHLELPWWKVLHGSQELLWKRCQLVSSTKTVPVFCSIK